MEPAANTPEHPDHEGRREPHESSTGAPSGPTSDVVADVLASSTAPGSVSAQYDYATARLSLWGGVNGPKIEDLPMPGLLAYLQSPEVADLLRPIQDTFANVLKSTNDWAQAKKAVAEPKKGLIAFQCGTADKRGDKNLKTYAHVVIADVDELRPERANELRATLKADPHVIEAGISPSGHGVKALFAVSGDRDQHRENWEAVRRYILKAFGQEIDASTKNVERLCFVFCCPAGEPNWKAVPLEPVAVVEEERKSNDGSGERREAQRAGQEAVGGPRRRQNSDTHYRPVNGSKLRELLRHIPADARSTWLRVLGAVKLWGEETEQEELAYEIADKWARTSEKYDDQDQPRVWDSLNRTAGEDTATVGTLFHLAKQNGWKPASGNDVIILPSAERTFSDCARDIFERTKDLYIRGGAPCRLVQEAGVRRLELITPDAFRSYVEKLGARLMVWRKGREDKDVLAPARMSADCAKAVMSADEARELLPPVASVIACPVITSDGDILGPGYHAHAGGLLIESGKVPKDIPWKKAARYLLDVVEDYDFVTPADRSRAMAELITPGLRLGGALDCRCPIFITEADSPQAGKGYMHECACAIYGDTPRIIAQRTGGVGSADESFQAALVAGRPFISLDNLRGKLDSAYLEAFVTAPGLFGARIPHHGEIMVDPRRFILMLTSNGVETTLDLGKRASICRIRKRPPGYKYFATLQETQRCQPFYLGCVFSLVRIWIEERRPTIDDGGHDFREWAGVLRWITQELLGCAPLMGGHSEAQERVSNPALSFFRACALAVDRAGKLGIELTASRLVEIAQLSDIPIPGAKGGADEGVCARLIGGLGLRVFRDTNLIRLEGYSIERGKRRYQKSSGNWGETPCYTFARLAHHSPQHPNHPKAV